MSALRLLILGQLLFTAIASVACAQGGSSTGSTSTSTSGGSTASGGTTINAMSTGGSAAGGGTLGGVGALAAPQFTEFGQAGANVGTGFVGRGNNTQAFVGQNAAGQQTVDAGGTARFSGLGGGGGGGATADVSQARGGQMRIARRIAFDVPQAPAPVLQAALQTQFATLQAQLPGIVVQSAAPGQVVLQGTVESDHAKRLAEAVARLEPGVRRVTNELQVAGESQTITAPRLGR